jgi:hypothetical protein
MLIKQFGGLGPIPPDFEIRVDDLHTEEDYDEENVGCLDALWCAKDGHGVVVCACV